MDSIGNASARPLCAEGCGFYGSEETRNMCSTCYGRFLKTQLIDNKTAKAFDGLSLAELKSPNPSTTTSSVTPLIEASRTPNTAGFGLDSGSSSKSRCKSCNKKVGLTGFKCRCGEQFCGKHRYATEHSCTFDYKQYGRENLIKENPLIKGDKLAGRI